MPKNQSPRPIAALGRTYMQGIFNKVGSRAEPRQEIDTHPHWINYTNGGHKLKSNIIM